MLNFLQEEVVLQGDEDGEDGDKASVLELIETWLYASTALKTKESSASKLHDFLFTHGSRSLTILIRVILTLVQPLALQIKSFQAYKYATIHTVEPAWSSIIQSFKCKDFSDDIKKIYAYKVDKRDFSKYKEGIFEAPTDHQQRDE